MKYGIIDLTPVMVGYTAESPLLEFDIKQMFAERKVARKRGMVIKGAWIEMDPNNRARGVCAFSGSKFLQSDHVEPTDKETAESIRDGYLATRALKIRKDPNGNVLLLTEPGTLEI